MIKDLGVDRSTFDPMVAAGGFMSTPTDPPPDANAVPVPDVVAGEGFDAAACIAEGLPPGAAP